MHSAINRLGGRLKQLFSTMRHLALIAAAVGVTGGTAFPQATPTEDGLVLYENLVRNPNDIAANLAYARALEADGRIEEARQIYRKILTINPDNPAAVAALAALTEPPRQAQTDYTLRTGGAIETNAARRDAKFQGVF